MINTFAPRVNGPYNPGVTGGPMPVTRGPFNGPGVTGGPMPVQSPPIYGGGGPRVPGGPMPFQPRPVLGTMHKGGIIKKSGLYNMKRGEKVVPTKGKLTSKERNALPSESFVFPKKRKYPIENASHARNRS